MKTNNKISFFNFNRSQKIGVTLLVVCIVLVQVLYLTINFTLPNTTTNTKIKWLTVQAEINSLQKNKPANTWVMQPFNPNFISDYKAYRFGMTKQQIDKLQEFRKTGKFINSVSDFQKVTQVPDTVLQKMAPFFKFPDWVINKATTMSNKNYWYHDNPKNKPAIQPKDINVATKQDLMAVYGIGEILSDKILAYKQKLGGFVSIAQVQEIWGIPPEVITKINTSFTIKTLPTIKKIPINTASLRELLQFVYFKYPLAKEILLYRSRNNGIHSEQDLEKIKGFPVEKIKIIALYLEFQ